MAPHLRLFIQIFFFVGTGIASTLLGQYISDVGVASWTMLMPLMNYIGMAATVLLPVWMTTSEKAEDTEQPFQYKPVAENQGLVSPLPSSTLRVRVAQHGENSSESAKIVDSTPSSLKISVNQYVIASVILDLLGYIFHLYALQYAGSSVFQVIYTSVIVWASLFSRVLNKTSINKIQAVGIAVVCIGMFFTATGVVFSPYTLLGIVFSFLSAATYGSMYALTESVVLTHNPDPRVVSLRIGSIISGFLLVYLIIFVIPRWEEVVFSIESHGSSVLSMSFFLFMVLLSALIHAITYFQLMSSTGAVTTGLMQAARGVGVLVMSHFLFCSTAKYQCITLGRIIATAIVVVGIVIYSYGKRRAKEMLKSGFSMAMSPGGNNSLSVEIGTPSKPILMTQFSAEDTDSSVRRSLLSSTDGAPSESSTFLSPDMNHLRVSSLNSPALRNPLKQALGSLLKSTNAGSLSPALKKA